MRRQGRLAVDFLPREKGDDALALHTVGQALPLPPRMKRAQVRRAQTLRETVKRRGKTRIGLQAAFHLGLVIAGHERIGSDLQPLELAIQKAWIYGETGKDAAQMLQGGGQIPQVACGPSGPKADPSAGRVRT